MLLLAAGDNFQQLFIMYTVVKLTTCWYFTKIYNKPIDIPMLLCKYTFCISV